jgi:hypothetical protein
MRAYVDLATLLAGDPEVVQIEKSPALGEVTTINGKFVVPFLEGVNLDTTAPSVLPIDGDDLSSQSYAHLLNRYPSYDHVYFNPLLQVAHINEFDLTAKDISTGDVFPTRVQTSVAPNRVALPAINSSVSPSRPGMVMTNQIDISAKKAAGADDFLVYWKIYRVTHTHDYTSAYGVHAGENDPSLTQLVEIDQKDSNFQVFISNNDGNTFTQVERLKPLGLCDKGTNIKLMFRNHSTEKIYLATFGFLF